MNGMLPVCMGLCCDLLMVGAIYLLFHVYLGPSRVSRRREYLAYGVCWLVNWANGTLLGVPMANLLISTLSLLALTLLYSGQVVEKLLKALLILCVPALSEMLVYGLMCLVHSPDRINPLVGLLTSRFLLVVLALMLKRLHTPRKSLQISRIYWMALLGLPGGSILLLMLLTVKYETIGGMGVLLISGVLFAMDLLAFYVLSKLEEYSAAYYERELLARQNQAYQAEFQLMRQSEEQVRALRHDMKNHLAILREYAAHGRVEEMERYLDTFAQKLTRPGLVHTGNPNLDSILNYKLEQTRQAGVRLELDVRLPQGLEADPFDLNVLLGNLLDNAIEGVETSPDKWLSLLLRLEQGVLLLKVANSYDGVVQVTQGPQGPVYHSRKGGQGHGLGLGIVERVVEKYHGQLQIHSEGTTFEAEALLYLEEQSALREFSPGPRET